MLLRVREVRQRSGLTQAELAHKIGCSSELISAIETERYAPDTIMLSKIAGVFCLSPRDLFVGPPCQDCPLHGIPTRIQAHIKYWLGAEGLTVKPFVRAGVLLLCSVLMA